MADKNSIVIPFVISYKEYRLYRWYSLMKESNYKFSDYIKYVLFCNLKDVSCNVGTVFANDIKEGGSIRTSLTITVNDGILHDWIIDIENSPVIRKSVLIKSVLSNAITECTRIEEEYIPSYAELDLAPFISNKYARYNNKESLSKQEVLNAENNSANIVAREKEKAPVDSDDSYKSDRVNINFKASMNERKEPLADDNKKIEMEDFLSRYSVGGDV